MTIEKTIEKLEPCDCCDCCEGADVELATIIKTEFIDCEGHPAPDSWRCPNCECSESYVITALGKSHLFCPSCGYTQHIERCES